MSPVATAPEVAPAAGHVPATATKAVPAPEAPSAVTHPLDPLTKDEIPVVSYALKEYIAKETPIKAIKFITSAVIPPPKEVVLAVLGIPLAPGEKAEPKGVKWERKAETDFIDLVTGDAYNATLTLKESGWKVDVIDKLPVGTQPQISVEELVQAEEAIRNDPKVQELAKAIGLTPDQIAADGWSIGYDDRFPESQRVQQGLLFARFSQHENLYAHPLDFTPVLDSNTMKVIHIDLAPHRIGGKLSKDDTTFAPLSEDSVAASGRERIPPPMESFDFLPDLLKEKHGDKFNVRDDVKPLHILQPEGVSFTMKGNELEWQKWKMHIGFSHREGIALSTITYNDDGEVRPVFYRLSLAEMVVPYAAPEFPHPRKFAFDAGEYGMGTMANDLTLGCDCLGQIHYLPGAFVAHDGSAIEIKNAICIHEEDAGLLWKHSDYRPGGRSAAVRSRRLVVSMCCTLANYEYIWNYLFYQDGTIELEIRLTGILQVYVQHPQEPNPYGTTIAPQVNAHYHQHIFSVRVDPMVDGLKNSVVETDVVPLPDAEVGSKENFAGNAFITQSKTLETAREGARDYDFEKDRRWKIVNPSRTHYASGANTGYAIGMKGGATTLLAREGGWVAKRAGFAKKALWVVKDQEGPQGGRIWPSGKYVPQTRDEPEESVGPWSNSDDKIDNEDIVLFLTVGTTHIPRPEDWPVMPVEHLRVTFKPQSFFKMNPGMDVPVVFDKHSTAAFTNGTNGTHSNGTTGASCCSN